MYCIPVDPPGFLYLVPGRQDHDAAGALRCRGGGPHVGGVQRAIPGGHGKSIGKP